jgi:hypothetical protein
MAGGSGIQPSPIPCHIASRDRSMQVTVTFACSNAQLALIALELVNATSGCLRTVLSFHDAMHATATTCRNSVIAFFLTRHRLTQGVTIMPNPNFDVLAHIEDMGDVHAGPGEYAGTRGKKKFMEGFAITLKTPLDGAGLRYRAHINGSGNTPWVKDGAYVGSRGAHIAVEG